MLELHQLPSLFYEWKKHQCGRKTLQLQCTTTQVTVGDRFCGRKYWTIFIHLWLLKIMSQYRLLDTNVKFLNIKLCEKNKRNATLSSRMKLQAPPSPLSTALNYPCYLVVPYTANIWSNKVIVTFSGIFVWERIHSSWFGGA